MFLGRTLTLTAGGVLLTRLRGPPETEATRKRVRIRAGATTSWERFQSVNITSSEHHIIGPERRDEPPNDIGNVAPPLNYSKSLETPHADIVLECPVLVWQMTQLHRRDDFTNDEC